MAPIDGGGRDTPGTAQRMPWTRSALALRSPRGPCAAHPSLSLDQPHRCSRGPAGEKIVQGVAVTPLVEGGMIFHQHTHKNRPPNVLAFLLKNVDGNLRHLSPYYIRL